MSITYPFVFSLIQQTAPDLLFWYRRYSGELFGLRDFLSEETDVIISGKFYKER